MNHILKLGVAAAQAAAVASKAAAFPYAQPHFGAPPKTDADSATFAARMHGRGLDRLAKAASARKFLKPGATAQGDQR